MRGLFVAGTGTGVGKSVLSAALLAAIGASGETVSAHKPVLTGLEEPRGDWPPDHELLAGAAGDMHPEQVAPLRYDPPVSPHLASTLAGKRLDLSELAGNARAAGGKSNVLIVEGTGGLLVPLTLDLTIRDLAVELALPLIVAATPGLGTINHTLLTIEAARSVRLDVRAVVLTPWPAQPSRMQRSNRETIARMGAVEVATLAFVESPERDALAYAGASLPWRRWL